jgi:hypothetical protein
LKEARTAKKEPGKKKGGIQGRRGKEKEKRQSLRVNYHDSGSMGISQLQQRQFQCLEKYN